MISLLEFYPDEEDMAEYPLLRNADRCWCDETLFVSLNEVFSLRTGTFKHVRIARRDGKKFNDWRLFQDIKNVALGEDAVAVQVFPAEKDIVDGSNTYHLWSSWSILLDTPNLKDIERYH